MGKDAKIKAATKASREGDATETVRHADSFSGRSLQRLTSRSMPVAKLGANQIRIGRK
jgi:hypothetical protein